MYHLRVTVTLNLTSDLVFRIIISGAYLLLFEVGIPNLECKCILEWGIVLFHFPVTVTLTSDLVSRIGITSIFFMVGIPNLVCGCFLGWPSVVYHFWVAVTSTSDLGFRIIMFGAFFYIYYLSWKSQIWCVVASLDGKVSCISFVTEFLE